VRNKDEIEALIVRAIGGIPLKDLRDTYKGADKDVQELASGELGPPKVFLLKNADDNDDVAFSADPAYSLYVEDELMRMWNQV